MTIARPASVRAFRDADAESARVKRVANIAVRAMDETTTVIDIYDEIGGWGVYASEIVPLLRAADGEGRTLELHLNSPGGDVFEGVAIASVIQSMNARVVAVVDGMAASIASLIAVSADEVRIGASAFMMIHRPWAVSAGNSDDLRATGSLLDSVQAMLLDAYERKAPAAGRESLSDMIVAETWLTAAEAVAVGLADVIVEGATPVAMADTSALALVARAVPDEALAAVTAEPGTVADPIEALAEEPAQLDAESAASIRAACAALDMRDRADGFISARAGLDDVIAQLHAARHAAAVAADEATVIDPTPPLTAAAEPAAPSPMAELGALRARQFARLNNLKS